MKWSFITMLNKLFLNKKAKLAKRCKKYLELGPPENMTNYVPGSITEVIISYGARQEILNNELKEIGSIILMESADFNDIEDTLIREYMINGRILVEEILHS